MYFLGTTLGGFGLPFGHKVPNYLAGHAASLAAPRIQTISHELLDSHGHLATSPFCPTLVPVVILVVVVLLLFLVRIAPGPNSCSLTKPIETHL